MRTEEQGFIKCSSYLLHRVLPYYGGAYLKRLDGTRGSYQPIRSNITRKTPQRTKRRRPNLPQQRTRKFKQPFLPTATETLKHSLRISLCCSCFWGATMRKSKNSSLLLVMFAIMIACSLTPLSHSAKKPVGIARKEDIPFIKCQVCEKLASQIHHQVEAKRADISPKKVILLPGFSYNSLIACCIQDSGVNLFLLRVII